MKQTEDIVVSIGNSFKKAAVERAISELLSEQEDLRKGAIDSQISLLNRHILLRGVDEETRKEIASIEGVLTTQEFDEAQHCLQN